MSLVLTSPHYADWYPTAGLVSMPTKQMSHQRLLAKCNFGTLQESNSSLMRSMLTQAWLPSIPVH